MKKMKDTPRNVLNYHVQELPNCCQNCKKRHSETVSLAHGTTKLTCSLACLNPAKPIYCDPVDPMGICDSYENGRVMAAIVDESVRDVAVEPTGGA